MTLPRRLRPGSDERQLAINKTAGVLSARGGVPSARPVQMGQAAQFLTGNIQIIVHGDDNTVERPVADLVFWVGAATPDNGLDFDLWYPADI
jgi:hypothetical protein